MKRVVILVSTLKIGGAEKQSIYLLNALKDTYETYLIVYHGDIIDHKNMHLIEGNNYDLVKLNGHLLKKLYSLYKLFRAKHVTHLFTYLTKTNLYGSIIAKCAGVKYTYISVRNSYLPGWKVILEKIAAFLSTGIIFNSHLGEILFKQKGFKNTVVIPNCFANISAPFKRAHKDTINIITVGRFVAQKDYFTAIKAVKQLKNTLGNFIFQIVGYGELENRIRKMIIDLGLKQNIEILISPGNITGLLNQADIYLSTSIFEGTSNSIMEAMNACLPIVATNVGDNSRLISDGVSGFLHNVGDYVAIAESLNELIDNYDLRINMGMASNKILKEYYSFKKFQNTYLTLVNKS